MGTDYYHVYAIAYDDYESDKSHELASFFVGDFPLDEDPIFSIEEIVDGMDDEGYDIGEWKMIDVQHLNEDGTGPVLAYLLYHMRMDDPYSEEGEYWADQGIRAFSNTYYVNNAWED